MFLFILPLIFSIFAFAEEASLKAKTIEGSGIRGQKSIIHAKGNVELKNQEIKINSEEIIINKETKQTTLPQKAKIIYKNPDNYNVTVFSEYLTGNPETKEVEGTGVKMLSNLISYQADDIKTKNPIVTLTKTHFSTCEMFKVDEQDPNNTKECDVPWNGYASKVVYDTQTKQFKAKHLFVRLHGVPIFYTPYISVNLNKKKDGFQQFNLVNVGGQQGITFVYTKDTKYGEFTFQPELYLTQDTTSVSKRVHNIKIQHEYKKNQIETQTELKTTLVPTNTLTNGGVDLSDKGFRYYIISNNKYYDDSSVTSLGISLASDRFVRQVYDMRYENYFTSNASYSNYIGNRYYNLDTKYYKAMTASNQNNIPSLISSATYNKILTKEGAKNQVTSKNEVMNFQRVTGLSGTRLNTALELQRTFKFKGFQAETKPSINMYQYSYRDTTSPNSDFAYRAVGDINTTLSQSFSYTIRDYITQIKPMLFIDYTSDATNGEITNEDSATSFVTDNNIFTMSRYNGVDVIDSGLKGAYGLNIQMQNKKNRKFNFFAGQRYNTESGFSNYVGRANASFNNVTMSSKFIIKNDDSQILLSNSNITLKPFSFIEMGFGYFYLDKTLQNQAATGLNNQVVQTVENILYSGTLKYKNHSIFANIVQNPKFVGLDGVSKNIISQVGGGIGYKSDCLSYRLGAQNQFFFNGVTEMSVTTFIFEINLMK